MTTPSKQELIESLHLQAHVEGGYYRRTYQSDRWPLVSVEQGERFLLSSIFYLLADDSPTGHWHFNRSDIVHYFHLGSPLHYSLIHPDGRLETVVMGPDVMAGQQLQLSVAGGTWKATHLPEGSYGLISEAVTPGYDFQDMTLGEADDLLARFPQHADIIRAYCRV